MHIECGNPTSDHRCLNSPYGIPLIFLRYVWHSVHHYMIPLSTVKPRWLYTDSRGGTSLPQDEDALSLINYLFCRSFCVGQAYMNLREASLPQESSLTR